MTDKEKLESLEKELELVKKQNSEYKSINDQASRLKTTTSGVLASQSEGLGKWTLSLTDFKNAVSSTLEEFAAAADPTNLAAFQELDERATLLQREFGATKGSIEGYKQSIADTIPELIKMGITEETALDNMAKLMDSMASTATLGAEAITEVSAAASISRVEIGKLASNFREVGVSIYDVGDQMKEVTDIARGAGVSVAGVSDKVVGNLNKMNLYNFDNGVKGLAKMAVTSERLGIGMERVFSFAEKIYDPEGAIEMAAGLQRLGVTASGLLDPLKAMDLAANDPEGLQKEIINVTKEFTKFNEANGKFEIMPGSKRRLREIAKEMGIPAEELAEMSIKAADFDMKMKQIQFPALATDQETKEMIAGMAQLKDGKAVINVKNEQTGEVELKQVDQLTASDMEALKKQQEEDSMTIEEVAKEQLSVSKQIAFNTAGFIKGIEMGKATAEPLEKLYTNIMGAQVDITRNLAKRGTTQASREFYQGAGQPVEDYLIGGITGNEKMKQDAQKNFATFLIESEQRLTKSSEEFMKETITDISTRFKDAYLQPHKIETKSDVNFNMTINGNDNVKNMDLNSIKSEIINYLTQTAEGKDLLKKAVENPNAPSAMVGSKN